MNPYKVFHSPFTNLQNRVHVFLVHPENGGNVGATLRAMDNMGVCGKLSLVGSRAILNQECRQFAKHAGKKIQEIEAFPDLKTALNQSKGEKSLCVAATARVGSASRPHPLWVRDAMERACEKLRSEQVGNLILVFGPESKGLTNHEVELCDWVVTIPSSDNYRSLNLAQAVLVFLYEIRMQWVRPSEPFQSRRPSQRAKLIEHIVGLARTSGFILPGDPFKMQPRLERVFSALPHQVPEIDTLHGFISQINRCIKPSGARFAGRYRHKANEMLSKDTSLYPVVPKPKHCDSLVSEVPNGKRKQ